jgi:hypothetical protein
VHFRTGADFFRKFSEKVGIFSAVSAYLKKVAETKESVCTEKTGIGGKFIAICCSGMKFVL